MYIFIIIFFVCVLLLSLQFCSEGCLIARSDFVRFCVRVRVCRFGFISQGASFAQSAGDDSTLSFGGVDASGNSLVRSVSAFNCSRFLPFFFFFVSLRFVWLLLSFLYFA